MSLCRTTWYGVGGGRRMEGDEGREWEGRGGERRGRDGRGAEESDDEP